MTQPYLVEIDHVDKTFYTHHFLQNDPDTGRRMLHKRTRSRLYVGQVHVMLWELVAVG